MPRRFGLLGATNIGLVILIGLCCANASTAQPEEKLIFFDDFNKFDLSVWKHELTASGGGNWEFEYYYNNRSVSYVRNSILYLRPQLTSNIFGPLNPGLPITLDLWGSEPADLCTGNAFYGCERVNGAGGNIINPIQSARIRTAESFTFTYGHVEIRAKLPKGDWLWPAIWMLPRYNQYGEWPASGEIDIVESRGNSNYPPGGVNSFGSTLHWGPYFGEDPWPKTHATYTLPSGDFSQNFHIFGLYWNQTSISTYVDSPSNVVLDVKIDQSFWQRGGWQNSNLNNPWDGEPKTAPFNQEFYLILNVAVGGTSGYFPDGIGGKPWTDSSPNAVNSFWNALNSWYPTWQGESAALQVDWIKVWQ